MKAQDLMIGDWVSVNGLNAQVFELAYNQTEKELTIGILDPQGEVYYCYEGYDQVEPIPLTAEILEKNGEFGKTLIGETIYRMGGDDYCVRKIGERYSFIRCAEYGASWWLFDIRYVHELQHALKLCGIEKDIKL